MHYPFIMTVMKNILLWDHFIPRFHHHDHHRHHYLDPEVQFLSTNILYHQCCRQNTDYQVIIYRNDQHHYHFFGQCDVNKDSVEKTSSLRM